jgi:hypothetical protein
MRTQIVRYASYGARMSEQQQGYLEPPAVGDEASTLVGSLERQRATFAWKCADLDGDALSKRLQPSTLSLGRLLKHLAYMEDVNFTRELGRTPLPPPWSDVEPEGRSEWAFSSADEDSPEALYTLWAAAADRSRAVLDDVLTRSGPGATYLCGGQESTVRRLLVDMIEEYGRHTGQADLIRESIDGRVGEDPPGPAVPFTMA